MLGTDVVVVEADRLVLSEREHALGAVVEAIERSHLVREYAWVPVGRQLGALSLLIVSRTAEGVAPSPARTREPADSGSAA